MKGTVQNEKNHCRCAHISRMGILYLLYIEIFCEMQLRTAAWRKRPQPLTSAMIIVRLTIFLPSGESVTADLSFDWLKDELGFGVFS